MFLFTPTLRKILKKLMTIHWIIINPSIRRGRRIILGKSGGI